ncbi:MAG: PIG-L deacetylase family protein [Anaerolineae bacterium]
MVPGKRVLMAIFAHPDDEAFGAGGTLAKYAAEGADVYLVMATRGEAGQIAEPDLATPANLPYVRERELRCACETYGIHPPRFLDYVDGQLTVVHQGQAVGKVVRLLRELRPQVVITFGPDGVYGHYDHIAVHRWATIAVRLAAEPDCFPEQIKGDCQPHQVSKLYYHVLTKGQAQAFSEDGKPFEVMMDGVPFPGITYPDEQMSASIDISAYLDIKQQALMCHVTQVGRTGPTAEEVAAMKELPSLRQESFLLGHSTVRWPEGIETDLFERVE